jgi:hypothetical protein
MTSVFKNTALAICTAALCLSASVTRAQAHHHAHPQGPAKAPAQRTLTVKMCDAKGRVVAREAREVHVAGRDLHFVCGVSSTEYVSTERSSNWVWS